MTIQKDMNKKLERIVSIIIPVYNAERYIIECMESVVGQKLKKNISVIASDKSMTPLHLLRKEIAIKCKRERLADAYGTSAGRKFETEAPYQTYRYSIVVENSITPYYFTEKITNCFFA